MITAISRSLRPLRALSSMGLALCLTVWAALFALPAACDAAPAPKQVQAPHVAPGHAIKDPFPDVIKKAMKNATRSYKAEEPVPDYLRSLTEAQWKGIRFRAEKSLWRQQNLPFEVELYHPGFIYSHTVAINVVSASGTAPLAYSPSMFNYNSRTLAEKTAQAHPGFAGFRIMYPLNSPFARDAITSFLGASYFQGIGKQARTGVHARGLALNTAQPGGEEFPYFREFWLVTPEPDAKTLTVYALMDAPSLTGAFRFSIEPGTSTVVDVESRVFLRKGATWPAKVGLAPLTSMFLYAEAGNGWSGEYRPEIHNSDGLLFTSGENAWNWSPLVNPGRLAVNTFPMENPRGFGLLQRDDVFDHYQDIDARFDRKTSIWVEPHGDWGPGRIELVEIPSTEEIHDNIVAFWVPDAPGAVGEEEEKRVMSFAYKLYWMTPGVTPHSLGRVTATRILKNPKNDTTRFIIDFESETLKALPADTGLTSLIEAPDNVSIVDKQLTKNPVTGGWRLSFTVRIPRQDGVVQSLISARDGSPRFRFRALLKKGENLPDPLTETWVYDLAS